ncbi:FecCD family ABC transporter permease [Shouchella shacheensis]|uniref:FecCD family ABC transporter permease n=1 Tax=Shouchella shacheensis TaxID=1649580 RepID=UPI001FE025C4|nr:iron ABC transporter permease [Shouchella shacheensis]
MLFLGSFLASVRLGQIPISHSVLIEVLLDYDEDLAEHVIVYTRVSRAVTASLIGSSLAIAGALLQALTRNPLASPGILGINAGALFFVVFSVAVLSVNSLVNQVWIAFLGAGLSALMVYVLGVIGKDGLSPIRIVLAGTAITALFVSFTQGLLVVNESNLDAVLSWMAGTVSGRSIDQLAPIMLIMIAATMVAFFLARPINILMSGEDIAKGLGQRTPLVKIMVILIAVFLAGGSVAVGGMIGFIGLVVPHIARGLVGRDHYWIIPYCVLLGASLLLLADVAARFVVRPEEMPIGIMTALLGAPFFIYIARRGVRTE